MKKKQIKKMIKKVVKNVTKEVYELIEDEVDVLSNNLENVYSTLQGEMKELKSPQPLPVMHTAELSEVKDKEFVKATKKIIKMLVKKNVKEQMKRYGKRTDKEINKYLQDMYGVFVKSFRKEITRYINKQLKEAGIDVPEEKEEKSKCSNKCPACAGITVKPVSEATGAEKELLKGILGMIGYSKEDLDNIFNPNNEDDSEESVDESENESETDNDDNDNVESNEESSGDNNCENNGSTEDETHDHANKKWDDEAIAEFLLSFYEKGPEATAEHYGITEATAHRYFKKWSN